MRNSLSTELETMYKRHKKQICATHGIKEYKKEFDLYAKKMMATLLDSRALRSVAASTFMG
jgi:hypothetical protein